MKVFIPYLEILWKRAPGSLTDIRAAGFDGVECHLIGRLRSPERLEKIRDEAYVRGLEVRLHQGWSWKTGQRIFINKILYPLGQLVPTDMPLGQQVRCAGDDPIVIYGNHVGKAAQSNFLYQTCSEYVDGVHHAMTFQEFVEAVEHWNAPIVFDTQHVLEWCGATRNVASLPTSSRTLEEVTEFLWYALSRYVKEIHLCDFDPERGPFHGRNVALGDGVFPLEAFARLVRATGWSGVITPEVNPSHLKGPASLRDLRRTVGKLFS